MSAASTFSGPAGINQHDLQVNYPRFLSEPGMVGARKHSAGRLEIL
ncbi:MAG: hypothetical protein P8Z67_06750 [Gammaproteobacteria bacterium]